jgi:hypothetical protein
VSVAVLKSDDELGYWEYSVKTEDHGEWNIQYSRTEVAGTDHTDTPDMYRMHLNVTWNGEKFLNSWEYGDEYPFLTQYSMNGIIAAAGVATMAFWYGASAKYHNMNQLRQTVAEMLGDKVVGVELAAINADTGEPISTDDSVYDPRMYLTEEDTIRMGPHAHATYAMYMELHHYGMATTTPEWRTEVFGKADIEPAAWGQECDCEHE